VKRSLFWNVSEKENRRKKEEGKGHYFRRFCIVLVLETESAGHTPERSLHTINPYSPRDVPGEEEEGEDWGEDVILSSRGVQWINGPKSPIDKQKMKRVETGPLPGEHWRLTSP